MSDIPVVFQAKIFNFRSLENSGIVVGRTRVFYKGLNNNRSFISEQFAKKLIESSIGVPVVGLWDEEKNDFTDHTEAPTKRAYGFVPENPHFAWESHLDDDGVEREYACFDVLLWVEKFPEARNILNAPLSMELNPKTIEGAWAVKNGESCFVFTDGEMLGFCALGKNVEPCFEGAAFFEKAEVNFNLLEEIKESLKLYMEGDNMEKEISKDFEKEEATTFEEVPTEAAPDVVEEPVVTNCTTAAESDPAKEMQETFLKMQEKIDTLQAQIDKLESENGILQDYKLKKEAEERQAVVSQYADVLTPEEIGAIDVNKYTSEELSEKFAALAYKKIKQTSEFKMIQTDKPIENDIDSIVQKYKERK